MSDNCGALNETYGAHCRRPDRHEGHHVGECRNPAGHLSDVSWASKEAGNAERQAFLDDAAKRFIQGVLADKDFEPLGGVCIEEWAYSLAERTWLERQRRIEEEAKP